MTDTLTNSPGKNGTTQTPPAVSPGGKEREHIPQQATIERPVSADIIKIREVPESPGVPPDTSPFIQQHPSAAPPPQFHRLHGQDALKRIQALEKSRQDSAHWLALVWKRIIQKIRLKKPL